MDGHGGLCQKKKTFFPNHTALGSLLVLGNSWVVPVLDKALEAN
jgi:hypothetical protein